MSMNKDLLGTIKKFYRTNRRLPSYSEMLKLFDVASKKTVYTYIQKLIDEGFLKKMNNKLSPTSMFFAIPVLGMIQAFNYQAFSSGIVKPILLAQGLAKAMITTAAGLIIAVPILVLYAYFRGRVITITSNAERASAEILHAMTQ